MVAGYDYEKFLHNGAIKNVHTAYYMEAAEFLGIPFEVITKTIVRFNKDGRFFTVASAETPLVSTTAKLVSSKKYIAAEILRRSNIPVPQFRVIKSEQEALDFWKEFNEIVIKPTRADGGKGVSILPKTESQVIAAYNEAKAKSHISGSHAVQAEKFIRGDNYRILVLGDKVIAAVHRKPPFVTGDGKSTIQQLIEAVNIKRSTDGLMAIPVDEIAKTRLSFDNLTMDSILETGKSQSVRLNANLSTGGSSRECLAELHPYYLELAINATKALGMSFSGVDLIAEDISDPKAGHAINEVNFHPGLRLHYKVDEGEVVPVAREIMKAM